MHVFILIAVVWFVWIIYCINGYTGVTLMQYLKQQKLSERKVSRFIGFHSSVGKTFADLASSVLKVLKKAIVKKIHPENFCVLSKICENCKTFRLLNFCRLW